MADVGPGTRALLASVGITDVDMDDPFHEEVVAAIVRLGPGKLRGEYLAAMQWPFTQRDRRLSDAEVKAEEAYAQVLELRALELDERAAMARDKYEQLRSAEIVKARDAGERNADIAAMRADLVPEVRIAKREAEAAARLAKHVDGDDQVAAARLASKVAKVEGRIARKQAWTISEQIKVWQSANANQRAADTAHARGLTGGA